MAFCFHDDDDDDDLPYESMNKAIIEFQKIENLRELIPSPPLRQPRSVYGCEHPELKPKDLNFPREYYESQGIPKEEIDAAEKQFIKHKKLIFSKIKSRGGR